MNRTFVLTSTGFTGEVVFEFNEHSLLVSYDLKGANLTEKQQVFILKNLPKELNDLQQLVEKSNTAKCEEMVVDFEKFWHKYNDKVNSSKKKTQAKWNKMTASEQIKAFAYINKYHASIPSGTRIKYAETYLNSELWNN